MSNKNDNKRLFTVIVVGAIGGLICLVVAFAYIFVINKSPEVKPAVVASSNPIATPVQPPTVEDVSILMHGTRVKSYGPAEFGVADAGTFWIDGKKYGVDTFLNKKIRDAWLQVSEPLGVIPKWITSTWVVYPSIDQPASRPSLSGNG